MMLIAGPGLALAKNQSVYQIPESFIWLGRGADLWKGPNAVLLMLLLYAAGAHVLMSPRRCRYLYAVGGNARRPACPASVSACVAVRIHRFSGLLAGLGGVVMASQLKSGSPHLREDV